MTDPFDACRVAYEQGHRDGYESARADGWLEHGRATAEALDAAQEAVEAIPAPYKVRGQYETYGPYNEGVSDLKDAALSAIDGLVETTQPREPGADRGRAAPTGRMTPQTLPVEGTP